LNILKNGLQIYKINLEAYILFYLRDAPKLFGATWYWRYHFFDNYL